MNASDKHLRWHFCMHWKRSNCLYRLDNDQSQTVTASLNIDHLSLETVLDRYTHFAHENVEKLAQINPYCDTIVTHDTLQAQ